MKNSIKNLLSHEHKNQHLEIKKISFPTIKEMKTGKYVEKFYIKKNNINNDFKYKNFSREIKNIKDKKNELEIRQTKFKKDLSLVSLYSKNLMVSQKTIQLNNSEIGDYKHNSIKRKRSNIIQKDVLISAKRVLDKKICRYNYNYNSNNNSSNSPSNLNIIDNSNENKNYQNNINIYLNINNGNNNSNNSNCNINNNNFRDYIENLNNIDIDKVNQNNEKINKSRQSKKINKTFNDINVNNINKSTIINNKSTSNNNNNNNNSNEYYINNYFYERPKVIKDKTINIENISSNLNYKFITKLQKQVYYKKRPRNKINSERKISNLANNSSYYTSNNKFISCNNSNILSTISIKNNNTNVKNNIIANKHSNKSIRENSIKLSSNFNRHYSVDGDLRKQIKYKQDIKHEGKIIYMLNKIKNQKKIKQINIDNSNYNLNNDQPLANEIINIYSRNSKSKNKTKITKNLNHKDIRKEVITNSIDTKNNKKSSNYLLSLSKLHYSNNNTNNNQSKNNTLKSVSCNNNINSNKYNHKRKFRNNLSFKSKFTNISLPNNNKIYNNSNINYYDSSNQYNSNESYFIINGRKELETNKHHMNNKENCNKDKNIISKIDFVKYEDINFNNIMNKYELLKFRAYILMENMNALIYYLKSKNNF